MKRTILALLTLAALGCTAPLFAQDEGPAPEPRGPRGARGERGERGEGEPRGPRGFGSPGGFVRAFPMFTALDENGDGEISSNELRRAVTRLKTLDANGDGKLTADELQPQFGGQGGPGGFGGFGRRGDGNQDPNAPQGEGEQGQRGRGFGGRGFGGPGGGQGQGPGGQGPGGFQPEAMVQRWMEFDADGDGKLSEAELLTMAQQFMRPPQGQGPGQGPGRGQEPGQGQQQAQGPDGQPQQEPDSAAARRARQLQRLGR